MPVAGSSCNGLQEQPPAVPRHHHANSHRNQGIQGGPAGEGHQQRSHQHGGGEGRITQPMQHRSPSVEAVLVTGPKGAGRGEVHHQPDQGSQCHWRAANRHRPIDTLQPFHDHTASCQQIQRRSGGGGQLGAASVAKASL